LNKGKEERREKETGVRRKIALEEAQYRLTEKERTRKGGGEIAKREDLKSP